jgi:HEPN domain-containing protein
LIDIDRHAQFLIAGSAEDRAVAEELLEKRRVRHALFFAHLALEKLLKALVVRATSDIPPRLHNLVRLAELANLPVPDEELAVLAELNAFNLAGRYPETLVSAPTMAEAAVVMARAKGVEKWLQNLL